MIVAEMDVWHSRAAVPTRRVALGADTLPLDPPPGFGGLLLAAVVAFYGANLPDADRAALADLAGRLERGERVAQPWLRYRRQYDRVGLTTTTHRLMRTPSGDIVVLLDRFARREPQLLAALYRAGRVPEPARRSLFTLLGSAMRWRSGDAPDEVDLADLLAYLTGQAPRAATFEVPVDPRGWALDVLGLDDYDGDARSLQRRFRRELRRAHPDHGGASSDAGSRIAALTAARRILLSPGAAGRGG
ncbi:MAG TPA: hypothetical protein DEP69_03060 [Acidimicrobiaceae bacterium]|nr:hypothetical protein [Acidimicrobiaceae bacterium]